MSLLDNHGDSISNSGDHRPFRTPGAGLLVLLAAMTPEQLESVLANLTASFPRRA